MRLDWVRGFNPVLDTSRLALDVLDALDEADLIPPARDAEYLNTTFCVAEF